MSGSKTKRSMLFARSTQWFVGKPAVYGERERERLRERERAHWLLTHTHTFTHTHTHTHTITRALTRSLMHSYTHSPSPCFLCQDDLSLLRIRTKKREILITPGMSCSLTSTFPHHQAHSRTHHHFPPTRMFCLCWYPDDKHVLMVFQMMQDRK